MGMEMGHVLTLLAWMSFPIAMFTSVLSAMAWLFLLAIAGFFLNIE